ncbi:type-F conjugative transfer system pilin acetylase TraX [Klebsiella aerogenes]|uniref:type-F conjugative transfer system pilin acetylase TraX n=1 Tax=Klebsiella aerogenes TaxID=548 RepID=UPI002E370400|nr:type-F conjugative transfer system pilin acetylase TraX [Klebsiella aerogenes]MED7793175.1 type-F conjugative transfer system pilin acetylase TraX [Klebsiella aerogenes]
MPNNHELSLSPQARDWLKVIAFAAMVVDHASLAFGWHSVWLRMVGRAAMPLFALVWGCNLASHPVSLASLQRTWMWAVLAQPVFFLALRSTGQAWYELNILFLFAASGLLLYANEKRSPAAAGLALIAVAAYIPLSASSYGLRGILLMVVSVLLFRVALRYRMLMFPAWLVSVFLLNVRNGMVMALAGLCLTLTFTGLCAHSLRGNGRLWMTRWFAPAYAFHLGLLFVLAPLA